MFARRTSFFLLTLFLAWMPLVGCAQTPPPDGDWTSDAVIEATKTVTDLGLGAVQGVVVRDGKVYAYGDVFSAAPRVGVIREYDMDLKPTGRVVWLRKGDTPRILHPTGLTWHPRWGTFLGDTVKKKAVIYRLDWEKAWSGRPGRLPTSAPHRSVRAQLRHTALQATNSPAASRPRPGLAIRRRPVEMVSRLGVPGIFPSGGLMARRLLPSTGSLGSVPPLPRYYAALRIPSTRPAALRFLRLAVSRSHPRFDPTAAGCAGRGPGVGHPVSPAGSSPRRWRGLPGSWGTRT
jgi:hypothetical protein